ncbi:MAG TPA: HAD-IA family hydrolase [Thermoanaerobaculia bacterium]|nr:HAD-IA family hydrolase [Thermoanaerobaculia bacterium]
MDLLSSNDGRPYRLLIFDWDGTLRDSIGSIIGCALEAAAEHGLEATAGAVRASVGLGLDEAIRLWCPDAADDVRRCVRKSYGRLWIDRWHARADLFPGVEEALTRLHADGYWMAVATGKGRAGLQRDFGHGTGQRVSGLFLASRTADETTPKPSPAMVHEILDELGVRPEEAIVIGDSRHDLEMAANAGCAAVGVEGGALPARELRRYGPRVVLPGVVHLADWLARASVDVTSRP